MTDQQQPKEIHHSGRAHALLSPSSAERWTTCTPSARMEEHYPDTTSAVAEEGTHAHELCERLLRGETEEAVRAEGAYTEEMIECAKAYHYYITTELGLERYCVEQRVEIPGVEGCFGTVDCWGVRGVTLYVIDYKYGQGVPVPAEHNKQLALYAYGLLKSGKLSGVADVRMTIFQPRTGDLNIWAVSAVELQSWVEGEILPRAELANRGEGSLVMGDHCRWCRAKCDCRAYVDLFPPLMEAVGKPEEVSEDEKLAILDRADDILDYIKALRESTTARLLEGEPVRGWKLVEGRSVRRVTDYAQVVDRAVSGGVDPHALYEYKPLGITALQKVVGRELMSAMEADGLIDKPQGAPTLVRESDKRPPLNLNATILSHF